jgi:arsenite-transporting ATPase
MEDLLDLAPPGLDELFAIVTLIEARERHDLVVVDTAPTGHTLRLLELPEHALAWVHAIMQILLKYRDVVGLGELAGDLTAFARRLRAFAALLADPARTAFVAVTRAAELPLLETERLVAALVRRRVPLGGVVCNALVDPACERCRAVALVERRAIARTRRSIVFAPQIHPPSRGVSALRAFRAEWRRTAA